MEHLLHLSKAKQDQTNSVDSSQQELQHNHQPISKSQKKRRRRKDKKKRKEAEEATRVEQNIAKGNFKKKEESTVFGNGSEKPDKGKPKDRSNLRHPTATARVSAVVKGKHTFSPETLSFLKNANGVVMSNLKSLKNSSRVRSKSRANSMSNSSSMISGQPRKKAFVCPECSREYEYKTQLEAHLPIHADALGLGDGDHSTISSVNPPLRPYKCSECVAGFQYQYQLITHSRTHTGEKPFVCKHCSERFNENGSLKLHILDHDQEQRLKFACSECEKVFSHRPLLINHLKVHNGVPPYQCHHCDRRYTQMDILQKHVTTHNSPSARPVAAVANSAASAAPSQRFYRCEKCGENFGNQGSLDVHRLLHTVEDEPGANLGPVGIAKENGASGSKPSQREEDDKKVDQNEIQQNGDHGFDDREEGEEEEQVCSHCDECFATCEVLKQHLRTKHGSFKCRNCESRFTEQASFLQHSRSHCS